MKEALLILLGLVLVVFPMIPIQIIGAFVIGATIWNIIKKKKQNKQQVISDIDAELNDLEAELNRMHDAEQRGDTIWSRPKKK